MKNFIALLLAAYCGFASAAQNTPAEEAAAAPVQQYAYGQQLDIARVLEMSGIPDVCNVVPARMTYLDHQGQVHVLEYQVMGTGCSQG
ncbi:DUF2790 domain-containing protein [Pseudomonas typographi]|uniref:DUF2790 domain-containing protein n=1 Tax=Pseudomonas typographi TaxID=2715964 RepID=UPI0016861FEE|nr:DUF2790 domain-containing protein [Pseudomonas typographi]MBD1589711.1 DUF2790 domain-containing protein [Pseudomonas typographi]